MLERRSAWPSAHRRAAPAAAIALACALALAGACELREGERFGRAGAAAGVLRVHVPVSVVEWDPPRAADELERAVARQLFATLLDADGQPQLARAVTVGADGHTVVVELAGGARYSDGVPVDADAVIWSWRRALWRSTGTTDLEPFAAIADGRALAEGRLLRVARTTVGHSAPFASVGEAPDEAPPLDLPAGTMVRVLDSNERRPCCGGSVALRREPDAGEALGALNAADVGTVIGARTVAGRTFLLLRASSGASGWAEDRLLAVQVPPASLLRVVDRSDGSAALRVGPEDDAPVRQTLADDDVVEVLGGTEGWADAVDLRTGHLGFVPRRALEPLRGEQQWLRVEPVDEGARATSRSWVALRDLAFDASALGARATDAGTIAIACEGDVAAVLAALAHPALAPVPPHVIAAHGRAWTEPATIVTTGPFVPTVATPDRLTLVRSETALERPRVRLQRVELVVIPDAIAALHLYRAGELEVLLSLPGDLAPTLARASDHVAGPAGGGLVSPEVTGLSITRLDLRDVAVAAP